MEFKSWKSYYDFVVDVRRGCRFIHSLEVTSFLEALRLTAPKRSLEIPAGKVLWRAQIGHAWQRVFSKDNEYVASIEHPFSPERMKPTPKFAVEGRANPKGILVMYTSTSRETCLAEVRPWRNSVISVAELVVNRPLKIVDCFKVKSVQRCIRMPGDEPTPGKRESVVWDDIDKAFSLPVNNDETSPDYVPTQIISELFRSKNPLGSGLEI